MSHPTKAFPSAGFPAGSRSRAARVLLGAFVSAALLGLAPACARSEVPITFVFVLDAARWDALQGFDSRAPVGVELQELARDAIRLSHARSPTSWTRPAVASLLTGLSPEQHRVMGRGDRLPDSILGLPSMLQARGVATHAWFSNPNVIGAWGFDRGFDTVTELRPLQWEARKAGAREVLDLVRKHLAAARDPGGFYYVHLMDPHAPYKPPLEEQQRIENLPSRDRPFPGAAIGERGKRSRAGYQRYLAEMLDVDAQLGAFFGWLRKRGLYDPALILVVSDHGEEFLDHGGLFHGVTLYEEMLRVPALVKLPGNRRAGETVSVPIGFSDLFATLALELGLEVPAAVRGRSVLAEPVERPLVAILRFEDRRKSAIYFQGHKLVVDHRTGSEELYAIEKDPKERHNLAASEPERVAELLAWIDRLSSSEAEGWHLRGCGCGRSERVTLRLRVAPELQTEAMDLEAGDRVIRDGELVELRLSLDPQARERESRAGLEEVQVPDLDEIRIPASVADGEVAPLELQADAEASILLAQGVEPMERLSGAIRIDPNRAAVAAGVPIDCREPTESPELSESASASCEPYVRVWRVPPPERIEAGELPPGLVEELRALGYAW